MSEPPPESSATLDHCQAFGSDVCGPQGPLVIAAAYLVAHQELSNDTNRCNGDVAIPWVWTARYAAELTFTGAAYALACQHNNGKYKRTNDSKGHLLVGLRSNWLEHLARDPTVDKKNEKNKPDQKRILELCNEIDQIDPTGMCLRYALTWRPGSDDQVELFQAKTFVDHCEWPQKFYELIRLITSATRGHVAQGCNRALGYLHYTAKLENCIGDYSRDIDYWDATVYEPITDLHGNIVDYIVAS